MQVATDKVTGYVMHIYSEDLHYVNCQLPSCCMHQMGWFWKGDIKEYDEIYKCKERPKLNFEAILPVTQVAQAAQAAQAAPIVAERPVKKEKQLRALNIYEKLAKYREGKVELKPIRVFTSPGGAVIRFFNGDCKHLMAFTKKGTYTAIIADPPYGINASKMAMGSTSKEQLDRFADQGNWDEGIPDDEYFQYCEHVSKYQLYWGANYFPYVWRKKIRNVVTWFKHNAAESFADSEIAACTIDQHAQVLDYQYFGNVAGNSKSEDKHHPTQKPQAVYDYIFTDVFKKVPISVCLDTHGGSGTSAVSAYNNNISMDWIEFNPISFKKAVAYFEMQIAIGTGGSLFD